MVFVFILLQWALLKMLRNWFVSLHNSIRDDKYLIGRNLENYEDKIVSAEPQQELKAIQASGEVVANDTTTTTTEETGEKELDGGDEETRSEQETVIAASEGEEQEKEKEEETLKEPSQAIDLDVVGWVALFLFSFLWWRHVNIEMDKQNHLVQPKKYPLVAHCLPYQ